MFVLILSILYLIADVSSEHASEICIPLSFNSTIPELKFDEAYLAVESQNNEVITFFGVSSNCYKCSEQLCGSTDEITNKLSVIVPTRFEYKYQIKKRDKIICNGSYQFGEHGKYRMVVNDHICHLSTEKKHIFTYLPLVVMFAILIALSIIYVVFNYFWRKKHEKYIYYTVVENDEPSDASGQRSIESSSQYGVIPSQNTSIKSKFSGRITLNRRTSPRGRLKSLDTFRGLSIVIMIFVNYGGGKYWFFNHSKWNGLTIADLVFPWFIFIMGSSIYISCRSMRRKTIPKRVIIQKIVIRSIKLFALGLFINGGKNYNEWRIPGVLQRFAGSYFVVAILNVLLSPDEDQVDINYNYDWRDSIRDLTWFPIQHLVMVLLLTLYLCLTFLLPVDNCPKGYLGAGGISDPHNKNCTGGAAAYIDRIVFGKNHIYQTPTCMDLYKCTQHDPEGLLGVIPSILLTYFGLMASRILFMYSRPSSHIKRWLLWALLLGSLAIGLCEGRRDGGLIPINKNLWSLSFIFATGSMAFILLAICYVSVDITKLWSGAPFSFAGMNAILLYCGHEILSDYFPFNFVNNGQHDELLTRSAVGTFVWVVISYVCYRTGTFFKV